MINCTNLVHLMRTKKQQFSYMRLKFSNRKIQIIQDNQDLHCSSVNKSPIAGWVGGGTFLQLHLWSSSDTSRSSPVVFTLQVCYMLTFCPTPSVVIFRYYSVFFSIFSKDSQLADFLSNAAPSAVTFRYYLGSSLVVFAKYICESHSDSLQYHVHCVVY
jgi:hypothetical protein